MNISRINPGRFTGRSVLITGCGSKSGIGFATAELLVAARKDKRPAPQSSYF